MITMIEEIEDRMSLREKIGDLRELIKLIGFVMILAHFFACAWHYVALKEHENGAEMTWLGERTAF